MGLEQLAPEMVCARLGFNPEVESGGKGGERSVLTWDCVCVCVCACVCVCVCVYSWTRFAKEPGLHIPISTALYGIA